MEVRGSEQAESRISMQDHQGCLGVTGNLINGIWPRSIALWMAAFYVALFIIRPWEKLFPELAAIRIERIYALLMITAVLLAREKRFRMSVQTVSVVGFFLAVGISALHARNSTLAWEPFYGYLTLLVFYFVLILVIRTPYDLVFMVATYIVAMAIYLVKAQWEFFVNDADIYAQGVRRMVGIENTLGGPNALAMSIVASLPMLLFLHSVREKLTSSWPSLWRKWFPCGLAVYLGLAMSSVALTNSRSGMLGVVLFVLLVAFRCKGAGRKLVRFAAAVLILLSCWLVMPAQQKSRFWSIWDPRAGPGTATVSAQGRIEGFRAGITMFKRFPLTGVGVGNFIAYRMVHVDGSDLSPHNLVSQLLGETGLFGGLAFVMMVGTILANCRKIRAVAGISSNPTLEVLSALALACRNAVILLGFEGLFGHNVLRFNWLWLGAFSCLALQYARQYAARTAPSSEFQKW